MNAVKLHSINTKNQNHISAGFLFLAVGLSFFPSLVIGLLLKIAVYKSFGIAFTISGCLSAYLTIANSNNSQVKNQKISSNPEPMVEKRFVHLGVKKSNINKILTPKKVELKKEIIEEKEIQKTLTIEDFQMDPIGHLTETQLEIMGLLDKSQSAFERLEDIFGSRLHKNTSSDINNFLLLRKLNDAFNLRLEEIIDTLDTIKKEQKLNLKKGFKLAQGALLIANDSLTSISDSATHVPPIEKKDWDHTLTVLLKKIARKKTFHHALNLSNFRAIS